jgi:5'-nucleotidase
LGRPTILVTNDDGIQSDGLAALVRALREADLGGVVIVAPDRERSAIGHAITLRRPISLARHADVEGCPAYACGGMPADAVILALHGAVGEPPQVVLAGINRGANLGEDLTYSGTDVGAVRAGRISVTPVTYDITERVGFDAVAGREWPALAAWARR